MSQGIFKVNLTRVGPGVFFALFGSLILYTSLTSQIKMSKGAQDSLAEYISAYGEVVDAINKLNIPKEERESLLFKLKRFSAIEKSWSQKTIGLDRDEPLKFQKD